MKSLINLSYETFFNVLVVQSLTKPEQVHMNWVLLPLWLWLWLQANPRYDDWCLGFIVPFLFELPSIFPIKFQPRLDLNKILALRIPKPNKSMLLKNPAIKILSSNNLNPSKIRKPLQDSDFPSSNWSPLPLHPISNTVLTFGLWKPLKRLA